MNLGSIVSLVLKWVYDHYYAITHSYDMYTHYTEYVYPIIFTRTLILFDCTIILMASFSVLSNLVHWMPDYFNTFSDLLLQSMNRAMMAIWLWSLYLMLTVAVFSNNLMGYYSYGWSGYFFAI